MLRINLGVLAGLSMLGVVAAGHAEDVAGSHDHPLLTRFAGAEIHEYLVSSFDETKMPIKPLEDGDEQAPAADKMLTVAGKVTYINYVLPGTITALEVSRNYEQALAAKGFQVLFKCRGGTGGQGTDCGEALGSTIVNSGVVMKSAFGQTYFGEDNRYLVAKRSSPQGDVYVMIYAMDQTPEHVYIDQKVVEVQPVKTGQVSVTDAAALKQSLDAQGKAAVYGVYFDTDQAELKPQSKAALDEMGKLLKANAQLKVYIVGHTDNQGTLAANLDLSQRRADAVIKALVGGYQIDARRLVAKGVASLAPVASNAGEPGRALNRRVELVVQ